MTIFPEMKKIAGLNAAIERLAQKLSMKMDLDGLNFKEVYLISGCKEEKGHLIQAGVALDNAGLVDDLYYCDQSSRPMFPGSLWLFLLICRGYQNAVV